MATDIHAATQALREAFESWWTNYRDGNPESLSRRGEGYFWADADRAWYVWQAATQARDAEIAALRAEVERLKPDAERYRWLRQGACFSILEGIFDIETSRHPGAQLDAAIDAARKDGV